MLDRTIAQPSIFKMSDVFEEKYGLDETLLQSCFLSLRETRPECLDLTIEFDLLNHPNRPSFKDMIQFFTVLQRKLPRSLSHLSINFLDILLLYGDSLEKITLLCQAFFTVCPPTLEQMNFYRRDTLERRTTNLGQLQNNINFDSLLFCVLQHLPASLSSLCFSGSLHLRHLQAPEALFRFIEVYYPSIKELTFDFRNYITDHLELLHFHPVLQTIENSTLEAVKFFNIEPAFDNTTFSLSFDELKRKLQELAEVSFNIDNFFTDSPFFRKHYDANHFFEKKWLAKRIQHRLFEPQLTGAIRKYEEKIEKPSYPRFRPEKHKTENHALPLMLYGYLAHFASDKNPLEINTELRDKINILLETIYQLITHNEELFPQMQAYMLTSEALINTLKLVMNPHHEPYLTTYHALILEIRNYGNHHYHPSQLFALSRDTHQRHYFNPMQMAMEELVQVVSSLKRQPAPN